VLTAWIGAALVGLSLGLLGSGGSILTVPILVLLVGRAPSTAVAESLAIVATISAFGALVQVRRGGVDGRWAALIAGPGIVGAWLGAHLNALVPEIVPLLSFALLAVLAGVELLRRVRAAERPPARVRLPLAALAGLGVGVLTGFLGVGGGFLIVPVLTLLAGLALPRAAGTSLVVIAVNSLVGFAQHARAFEPGAEAFDARLVALFAAIGIAGSALGMWLAPRLALRMLQRVFAWTLFAVGAAVAASAVA